MAKTYTLSQEWLAGDVPALTVSRADLPENAPLVLVLHGLGSRKEKMLPGLYAFAQNGCRAVAFDLARHGERPGAERRDIELQTDYFGTNAAIIEDTARDVSRLLDALGVSRAAIHGISLGGYVTFAALLSELRLAVASVAMGSPDWVGPLRRFGLGPGIPAFDRAVALNPLDLLPRLLPPRPLLMQHGTQDDVVSPDGVIALAQRLRPLYAASPESLVLDLVPGLGHTYTDEMQARAVAWVGERMGIPGRSGAVAP